ncbi:MAG TPA: HEAT repeat domain-containing protein, partial [Telluria sp.]
LEWLARPPVQARALAAPARAADAGRLLLAFYAAGVLLHLLHTGTGLVRLFRLARKAKPVRDDAWGAALARLKDPFGVARPVRLLVSTQLRSPLSWGLRAPVIVLDPRTLAGADPAAVLAHELAHIARLDWPAMLFGRALVALYWWHPLMHLLFRTAQDDVEHAADDAVLAAGVPASDYAHTLLAVSRHAYASAGSGLASQIAGRGKVLARRVGALLEPHQARGAVSIGQWLFGCAATLALIAVLGGAVQRGEHVVWPDAMLATRGAAPGVRPEQLLAAIDNPHFRQLARAMRAGDFSLRHANSAESFRQRAAIPALVQALQDGRPVVRQLAAWGLSEMRFPETAPALAALLTDKVPEVRAEAAGALGDMGETRWLSALEAMLHDPHPGVRARVAHVLGDLAEPASASALQAVLQDPDEKVSAEARWALSELR